MKSYTIKDIARMAEVSPGTVDRVIHQRGKVSEQALKKVQAVLEQIQYEPNILAKSLKNQQVYDIGILLPEIGDDNYWRQVHEGVQQFEEAHKGYNLRTRLVTFSNLEPASFAQAADELLATTLDAVFMAPLFLSESLSLAERLQQLSVPLITINNEVRNLSPLSFIGQDLHASGRTAAYLLHQSMRNIKEVIILHLAEDPYHTSPMTAKSKGLKEYFEGREVRIHEITIHNVQDDTLEETLSHLTDLSQKPGIFITNSKAHQVAFDLRLLLPKSVIVGYDLIPRNIDLLHSRTINYLINQNPTRMAFEGLSKFADHFIFGKEIPDKVYLPIDVITPENIASYL